MGDQGVAIGCVESQIFPAAVEVKVGMELPADSCTILPGGEDDQVSSAREGGACRKLPAGWVERVIGEKIPAEVEDPDGRIVDLDPVGIVTVLVIEGIVVDGNKLVDHRSSSCGLSYAEGAGDGYDCRTKF